MKLVFTKGSGKFDFMEVFQQDIDAQRVNCPKQRIIPHEMMHYAIEHTLEICGFLGRIKAGENASAQMKAQAESDSVERLVEVFQGDEWSGRVSDAIEMIDMYRVTCDARECTAIALNETAIHAIRNAISELSTRWQNTSVGGELHLEL